VFVASAEAIKVYIWAKFGYHAVVNQKNYDAWVKPSNCQLPLLWAPSRAVEKRLIAQAEARYIARILSVPIEDLSQEPHSAKWQVGDR
jgi:hypothetical protein